ncbi:MAG TPA: hypothetical protein PKB10_13635 [Tepidisphaeraceae bacterium]|nr:hypothetical protein [Tepidisphaeraceae bacterium]
MNNVTKMFAMLSLGLGTMAVVGCDDDGPAERTGERVDNAMERAGEKVEEAGEKVQEGAKDAERAIEDAAD